MVPPTQQAASSLSPPSVLVPVAGVLKRDGKCMEAQADNHVQVGLL